MTSWWTEGGPHPHVAYQASHTRDIVYSYCGTANLILPQPPPSIFPTTIPPREGTGLAGTGWVDSANTFWASPAEIPLERGDWGLGTDAR